MFRGVEHYFIGIIFLVITLNNFLAEKRKYKIWFLLNINHLWDKIFQKSYTLKVYFLQKMTEDVKLFSDWICSWNWMQ